MLPYCIYVTYHSSGKFYVGKTATYRVLNGSYKGSGYALLCAFKKYPKNEWITEIVKEVETEDEAYTLEQYWVDKALIEDPYCLNINLGGKGGCRRKQSAEELRRRSEAIRRAKSSPEHREMMSRVSKEASSRPEVKLAKIKASKLSWEQHGERINKARSAACGEEWKRNLSKAFKGKKRRSAIPVEIDGVRYPSRRAARLELCLNQWDLVKLPGYKELA